jgi:hypothetical protein
MHMVGYFEEIDSEHGIAWRCADSLPPRDNGETHRARLTRMAKESGRAPRRPARRPSALSRADGVTPPKSRR